MTDGTQVSIRLYTNTPQQQQQQFQSLKKFMVGCRTFIKVNLKHATLQEVPDMMSSTPKFKPHCWLTTT
jgi:hypothetical protein